MEQVKKKILKNIHYTDTYEFILWYYRVVNGHQIRC